MEVKFVQNDTGSILQVTCIDDQTGLAISLTGATVKLKYKIALGALQTKTMTPDPDQTANKGKATYKFLAGELATGPFNGEVEVTDSGGFITTSLNMIALTVRARL